MIFLTAWMAIVAALYATAGQAGGSGFVAVMTFGGFSPADIRPISLVLNIVAASYATLQIHRAKLADWPLLGALLVTSVPAAFLGGTIILRGAVYFGVTGTILLLVSALMAVRKPQTGAVPVRQGTALIAGAVTGLASGITGIGGGAILSAILILFAKASAKKNRRPVAAVHPCQFCGRAGWRAVRGPKNPLCRTSLCSGGNCGGCHRHGNRTALDVRGGNPLCFGGDLARRSGKNARQGVFLIPMKQ